jgi:hypothetical protein
MKRILGLTGALFGATIVFYLLVYHKIFGIETIYLLPIVWLITIVFILKLWILERTKLLIALHFIVISLGGFSFICYQLYLDLKHSVSINTEVFSELNSLMFNSENAVFLMVYLGVLVFFFDLFLLIRRMRSNTESN